MLARSGLLAAVRIAMDVDDNRTLSRGTSDQTYAIMCANPLLLHICYQYNSRVVFLRLSYSGKNATRTEISLVFRFIYFNSLSTPFPMRSVRESIGCFIVCWVHANFKWTPSFADNFVTVYRYITSRTIGDLRSVQQFSLAATRAVSLVSDDFSNDYLLQGHFVRMDYYFCSINLAFHFVSFLTVVQRKLHKRCQKISSSVTYVRFW